MKWRDNLLQADANNLTIVRLVLASSVIYTHSYEVVTGVSAQDDLSPFLGAPISVFAVDGFFFLSGFLVYPSLLRMGHAGRFLMARFTRLWPGLAVSVGLTVAAGAFLTTAVGFEYFGPETLKFIFGNLSFVTAAYYLTGVDCGTEACNINGSLWTLPWEIRCYLGLALLSWLGLARPVLMGRIVLPLSFVGAIAWHVTGVQDLVQARLGDGIVFQLAMIDRLWTLFALGIGAYLIRHRIPLSWTVLTALFVLNALASWKGLELHTHSLLVGYAVLCFGMLTASKNSLSGKWPDYSFGMYIYAFPIMMGVQALFQLQSYWLLTVLTFGFTLPLAALSWHFVEQPALDAMRGYLRRSPLAA